MLREDFEIKIDYMILITIKNSRNLLSEYLSVTLNQYR
jgi:hypothetical protein